MVKKDNQIPINALLSELNITEKDPKKILKILKSLPVEDMLKAQYKSVEVESLHFLTTIFDPLLFFNSTL